MSGMTLLYRIELNLFSALFLGIVVLLARHKLDRKEKFNRYYLLTCVVVIVMLLFEALTCVLNHNTARWAVWLSLTMHAALFSVAPTMAYLWYLMADTTTLYGDVHNFRISKPLLVPVALIVLVSLLSPFTGMIFSIDASGTYHRGAFFYVNMIVTYGYLLAGFAVTLRRRKNILTLDYYFLLCICLMPLVGGLLQGLFYGLLLLWACCSAALIVTYLYLQERLIHVDPQTGAWTRNSLQFSLQRRLKLDDHQPFGLIYADVDGLKAINDQYGHIAGDEAIKAAVGTLRDALRENEVIARFGGDEFLLMLNLSTRRELDDRVKEITDALAARNRNPEQKYKLSLSLGAELFPNASCDLQYEDLLNRVDRLMYENKRINKRNCSAKADKDA